MIFMHEDGTYGYTKPIKGTIDGVNPGGPNSVPQGKLAVAYYHTHGAYDPLYNSEQFSTADINYARAYNIDGYVATPGGRFGRAFRDGRVEYQDNVFTTEPSAWWKLW